MLTPDQTGPAPRSAARQCRLRRHPARLFHPRRRRFRRHLQRPQHRHRLERRSRRKVRENRRRVADWMGVAAERLLTAYQVHSPDVIVGARTVSPASARRPTRIVTDRPGIADRRLVRRLRSGAVCRCRGARHRRGACRLEGRLHRRAGKHDRGHGTARRQARAHRRRAWPLDQPRRTTRSGRNSSSASSPPTPATTAISRLSRKPGHAMFDLNRYTVDRLDQRRRDRPRRSTAAPMPRRICSIPTAAPRIARKPDYGRQISAIVLEEI